MIVGVEEFCEMRIVREFEKWDEIYGKDESEY
jgi:hypothetical protein